MKKVTHLQSFLTAAQIAKIVKAGIRINENSNEFYALKELVLGVKVKTCSVKRSGKWNNISDYTAHMIRIAEVLCLRFELGNDAPMGGRSGKYIVVDKKQLTHNISMNNKAKEAAVAAMEANLAAVNAEVESLPIDAEFIAGLKWAAETDSFAKSERSASVMKGLLARNGVEKIETDFWKVFRLLKQKAESL